MLTKLKLTCTNQDLAFRLDVSVQTVSLILRNHLNAMATAMAVLVPRPESARQKLLKINTPKQCLQPFPRLLRVIIDCTEVFIERSKTLLARAQTFSQYKSQHHKVSGRHISFGCFYLRVEKLGREGFR